MTDEKDKGGDEIEFIPDAPPAGEGQAPGPPAAAKTEPEDKAADDGHRVKDKLKKKDAEIKSLKKDLDELKEAHLRRLADMENLRKRFEREKSEFQQYALSGLLADLLVVGDNFERAMKIGPSDAEAKTFREGVDLIFRMFQNLLVKHGVRPIVLENRAFDPNFHHATIVEESAEVEEPTVAEELQKGYMLHDRLLRPTLVKVLVPKKG